MSGTFSAKDALQITQSVRKDGHWKYFERQIKISSGLFDKPLRIAEIGCGSGDNVILAHKRFPVLFQKFYCIDSSQEMLDFIRQETHLDKAEIICLDVDGKVNLPKADVYIAKFMFHHIKHKKELLESVYKILPKNGCIIIIDKYPAFGKLSTFIENLWDKLGIKKVLGTHYYTPVQDFLLDAKDIGFDVEDERIKTMKKLKNFFILKGFFVLRK